jgi:ribose 5-phosphate isomerase B
MNYKKIFVGCDHAGISLKKPLMELFPQLPWEDCGTFSDASVDYPDFAETVVQKLKDYPGGDAVGVLICGSGQGMAISANRHKHIRAALCWNVEIARLSRAHNNANVLCLGARSTDPRTAQEILKIFLNTSFEGGRHEKRVAKFS